MNSKPPIVRIKAAAGMPAPATNANFLMAYLPSFSVRVSQSDGLPDGSLRTLNGLIRPPLFGVVPEHHDADHDHECGPDHRPPGLHPRGALQLGNHRIAVLKLAQRERCDVVGRLRP